MLVAQRHYKYYIYYSEIVLFLFVMYLTTLFQ
jgi:hypothetical protein